MKLRDYDGTVTGTAGLYLDTTAIVLGLMKYAEERYQHPDVPLRFIPYNYHSSHFGVTLGYTELGYGGDFGYISHHTSLDEVVGSVGGEYYFSGRYLTFVSGDVRYGYQTREGTSNDRRREQLNLQLATGIHSASYKFGFRVRTTIENDDGLARTDTENAGVFGVHNRHYWVLAPFAEYMITPRMMLAAAFERRPRGKDFLYQWYLPEWQVPLAVHYINTEHWFEVSPTATYMDFSSGYQIAFELGIRHFIGDGEIFVIPGYSNIKYSDDSDRKGDMYSITVGGSWHSDRSIVILPSITRTWGDHPFAVTEGPTGTKFNLAFKALL
jgi:hypothetical protein